MPIKLTHTYENIISLENLLEAWQEFVRGKRKRKDVLEFQLRLMDNILSLHKDLREKTYVHSDYEAFNISDPKPRSIHKASVRDRLLHHALYRILYPFFDRTFIYDSYSCRKNKGTHKALTRFTALGYKVSRNHTRTVWVLKCDIRKFFASINHEKLISILEKRILDKDILWLLLKIIKSFHTDEDIGLPLGNLTSQLLVNIYMNEFDQFVKHVLKVKVYVRYADDFVFMSDNKEKLECLRPRIELFLWSELRLTLHPDKVFIKTLSSGVDFLGWIHFTNHRIIRTTTKRRMLRRLEETNYNNQTVQSYLGLLQHGNSYDLRTNLKSKIAERDSGT